MPASQNKTGHINKRLSNVSYNFPQSDYVFPMFVPEQPVTFGSDDYTIFDKQNDLQAPDDRIGKFGEANEIKWAEDVETYSVENRALKGYVASEDMDNADDPLEPQITETETITAAILNRKEQRAFALATSLITNTATPATKWNVGGTPVQDVQDMQDALWKEGNTMIIAKRVFDVMKFHPDIIAKLGGGFTNVQMARLSMFAELFGIPVDRIKIANAKISNKKPPQALGVGFTDSPRVWDNEILICWTNPQQTRKTQTFATTFAQKLKGTGNTMQTRTWTDPNKGVGGAEVIQVEHRSIEKVISEDFGFILTDILS